MSKDKKDKESSGSIGKVGATTGVKKTTGVERVDGVTKTTGVSRVGAVSGKDSRVFSVSDRDRLFQYVDQEADDLFQKMNLSDDQRKIIRDAVKMAIDSGLIEDEKK